MGLFLSLYPLPEGDDKKTPRLEELRRRGQGMQSVLPRDYGISLTIVTSITVLFSSVKIFPLLAYS